MSRSGLERVYVERGLGDYKLRTLDDLFYIYGVKLNQIDGYCKLEEDDKAIFNRFVINYFNIYGLECRNICILKVNKNSNNLKVEFLDNGRWRVANLEWKTKN